MGTIRTLQSVRGMMGYLGRVHVLLKDFRRYAEGITTRIRDHGDAMAKAAGSSVQFIRSSSLRKEALVERIVEQKGIKQGLVGVFSSVEPCSTYFLRRDGEQKHLVLEFGQGKCLHHYYYFMHEQCALIHLRLQTWFPFGVTLWINGRQWLARQMKQTGIGFVQKQNCFLQIDDVQKAQRLVMEQLRTDWPALLDGLLEQCHPLSQELCAPIGQHYSWSLKESEYATDVMFESAARLARLYPRFLRHGIEHFESSDVLRFLGKNVPAVGVHGNFDAEVNTSLKRRPEGVRIKHSAAGNSIKLYDKEGSVLRVETTINHPEVFKVLRRAEKHPEEKPRWLVLRKGVADTYRRAELCRAANARYLEALAVVEIDHTTGEIADSIFKRIRKNGRPYRSLNPWSHRDATFLEAVSSGDWVLNGFRNRDIRQKLFGNPTSKLEQKRQAARITRLLMLLRAHGILKKVTGTHRYLVSPRGRQIITALQIARKTSIQELTKIAA